MGFLRCDLKDSEKDIGRKERGTGENGHGVSTFYNVI